MEQPWRLKMRKGFALLAALLLVATSGAMARDNGPELATQLTIGAENDRVVAAEQFAFSRQDTIYFGGDDGTGYAIEGGVWDFEGTGGSGDFQGWTSIDVTEDPGVFFSRVIEDDFATDPCSPMFPAPSTGQLWCGIHEELANDLDYVSGIGYKNYMCQSAYSPEFVPGDVSVSFSYFNDSEVDFDYTFLYVLCYGGSGELLDDGEIEMDRIDGDVGSPETPETWSGDLDSSAFPTGTA